MIDKVKLQLKMALDKIFLSKNMAQRQCMMDLKSLRTFYTIAQLGGFHKAAEKLHTSQPAVSARIAQLETQLKCRLLERNKRGCLLTPQGRDLLTYAKRMFTLENEMVQAIVGHSGLRGTVSLGVSDTIVHTWLSDLLKHLNQEYPDITLEVVVDSTVNLAAGLENFSFDVALLMGPVNLYNAENLPLCQYPITWIKSPDLDLGNAPPTLKTLAEFPIITFARTTQPYWKIKGMFEQENLYRTKIFAISALSSIARLALDKIGVAAIPQHVVREELARGKLEIINTQNEMPVLSFTASFIDRPDMPLNRVVAQLAQKVAADYRHA